MVNLPLKKNFAPVTSTASSITNIMNDLQKQQENLSSIIGNMNSTGNIFSDDLVSASSHIDSIIGQTTSITDRLAKQQQVLTTMQTRSVASSADLVSTLSGEINNLKTVTSSITSQATSLGSIVDKGINLGLSSSTVEAQLNTAIGNFSNTANSLISGLNAHADALNSVIASSEKTLGGGLISNLTASTNIPSVQNLISGTGLSNLSSELSSLTPSSDEIQTVTREINQSFTDISDKISGKIDDLKNSVVNSISAKITSKEGLLSVAGDLNGALAKATDGLTKMQNPLSQLPDISSTLSSIQDSIKSNLGSIQSDTISGFTDQIGQINDIVGSMSSLGSDVTGQINSLTSTISSSIENVGGFNSVTGAIGGVNSLTDIVDPSSALSSSLTDLNGLSRNLMVSASNLSQMASALPGNNPINDLTKQLISVGQSINDQTLNTPTELDKLAETVAIPSLNVSSIEKVISATGSDLTSQNLQPIVLNVNPTKLADDLTKQILTISNAANSIPGS